ncbi:MAG: SIS domain-containing protein [Bacteroidia bacterium]
MKSNDEILALAKKTLETEANAISGLQKFLAESFAECVKLIYSANARVIITGIGKSAIIAQKIVATMNSTGTPAIYMHGADAIHGDLGIIQEKDVIICISKSGNTPEIKVLLPLLKRGGNKLIAIVGNMDSFLVKQADFILNTTVDKEACPNNLAPTSSTAAQLAMGDALAVCLLDYRGFTESDFAHYHPGGALGKKLYLKVSDLASQNERPKVKPDSALREVILEISKSRLGATAVLENERVKGIITDGDIRRMLEKTGEILNIRADFIMNTNPKKIEASELALTALKMMQEHNISQLVVVENQAYKGFVHLHDLMREGIL